MMRIFVGQLNPTIGAIEKNCSNIIQTIEQAKEAHCELAVFAEMAICGYNPEDLLLKKGFLEQVEEGLQRIIQATDGITVIVGTVRQAPTLPGKPLYNSAAVIANRELVGFQDKCLLPTYDVFDEWRYFEPAKSERIWQIAGKKVGITICEDIWPALDPFCQQRYRDDPLDTFRGKKLDLAINISASPYSLGKIKRRKEVAKQVAKELSCPMLIVNQVGANDGLLFDGSSVFVDAAGQLIFQAKSFEVDRAVCEKQAHREMEPGEELFKALSMGVHDYFAKHGLKKALIGISGGIDSAVVAAIAVDALGQERVDGLFLPSSITSSESREDAFRVSKNLGISIKEISIRDAYTSCETTLKPFLTGGELQVTGENLQARLRAIFLMAVANSHGYLVLNTGNKSELAMGYTTLYGDAVGSIAVLGDLLKRQVYEIARYINRKADVIPERTLTKPPSAELRPNQRDSDTIPEYPILDPIVQEYVVENLSPVEISLKHGFDRKLVEDVIQRIHANEYKRRQAPFALRVSDKAFSTGRRVPIVHK